jgi:hypothetical protein
MPATRPLPRSRHSEGIAVNAPAFPAVDPNRELPKNAGAAPQSQAARGPRRISPLVLGAAFACVLAAGVLGAWALRSSEPVTPSRGASEPARPFDPLPVETPETPGPRDRSLDNLPASAPEPNLERAPAEYEAPERTAGPADWPPARAFTARCKAPDGGCLEQCTPLAGGRCLDPCFIHTAECSPDCRKLDGTCGWPPPDSE